MVRKVFGLRKNEQAKQSGRVKGGDGTYDDCGSCRHQFIRLVKKEA